LKMTSRTTDHSTTVTVTNPGKSLAFAVHLKVRRETDGEEVLPVLWEDNYFPLLPGQTRRITATYQPLKVKTVVEIDGWNVK
jgi:exo-1,4-beta-D-glucosaminidase